MNSDNRKTVSGTMKNGNMISMLSVVIPVYNEEGNIEPLYYELRSVLEQTAIPFEILFINDASTDDSLMRINLLAEKDPRIRIISFQKNMGQSAALAAGFKQVAGDVTITMDADLQNDPHDICKMLELYKTYDMVAGWRYNRRDSFSKRISSKIGNGVRNFVTDESIHDTGCSLKVMKTAILKEIKMFKGLHRFLPILMKMNRASVIEVKVNHRPRKHGQSKYTNIKRGIEGICDLFAIKWMIKRNLTI